jgi:ribulose-phosphate 3-epimerase
MMVANPRQWVDTFAEAGAGIPLTIADPDLYCFHIEALSSDHDIAELISYIQAKDMKVGIAIKPKTPAHVLYQWIPKIDMALVMVHLEFTYVDRGAWFRRTKVYHLVLRKGIGSS